MRRGVLFLTCLVVLAQAGAHTLAAPIDKNSPEYKELKEAYERAHQFRSKNQPF